MGCDPISWLRHITRRELQVATASAVEGGPQIGLSLEVEYEFEDGLTAKMIGAMNQRRFEADMHITTSNAELYVRNPLVRQHGNQLKLMINGETQFDEKLTRRPTYEYQPKVFVDAVRYGNDLPTTACGQTHKIKP